jgi:hypothetical protein
VARVAEDFRKYRVRSGALSRWIRTADLKTDQPVSAIEESMAFRLEDGSPW